MPNENSKKEDCVLQWGALNGSDLATCHQAKTDGTEILAFIAEFGGTDEDIDKLNRDQEEIANEIKAFKKEREMLLEHQRSGA